MGDLLYDIVVALYQAYNFVTAFGYAMQGIPVIGTGVASHIFDVAHSISTLAGDMVQLMTKVRDIEQWLNNLRYNRLVASLITEVWTDFSAIASNPGYYIKTKMLEFVPYLEDWIWNPLGLLLSLIKTIDPDLSAIISGGWHWIRDKMYIYMPALVSFADNPFGYIRDTLNAYIPGMSTFLSDPVVWLKLKFTDELGVSYSFWYDPWRYVWEYVLTYVEGYVITYQTRLYRLGERILRLFWEGI